MRSASAMKSSAVPFALRNVTRVAGVPASSCHGTTRMWPSSSFSGKGLLTLKPRPSSSTANWAPGQASLSAEMTGAGSKVTVLRTRCPPGSRGSRVAVTAPFEQTTYPRLRPSARSTGMAPSSARPVAMTTR